MATKQEALQTLKDMYSGKMTRDQAMVVLRKYFFENRKKTPPKKVTSQTNITTKSATPTTRPKPVSRPVSQPPKTPLKKVTSQTNITTKSTTPTTRPKPVSHPISHPPKTPSYWERQNKAAEEAAAFEKTRRERAELELKKQQGYRRRANAQIKLRQIRDREQAAQRHLSRLQRVRSSQDRIDQFHKAYQDAVAKQGELPTEYYARMRERTRRGRQNRKLRNQLREQYKVRSAQRQLSNAGRAYRADLAAAYTRAANARLGLHRLSEAAELRRQAAVKAGIQSGRLHTGTSPAERAARAERQRIREGRPRPSITPARPTKRATTPSYGPGGQGQAGMDPNRMAVQTRLPSKEQIQKARIRQILRRNTAQTSANVQPSDTSNIYQKLRDARHRRQRIESTLPRNTTAASRAVTPSPSTQLQPRIQDARERLRLRTVSSAADADKRADLAERRNLDATASRRRIANAGDADKRADSAERRNLDSTASRRGLATGLGFEEPRPSPSKPPVIKAIPLKTLDTADTRDFSTTNRTLAQDKPNWRQSRASNPYVLQAYGIQQAPDHRSLDRGRQQLVEAVGQQGSITTPKNIATFAVAVPTAAAATVYGPAALASPAVSSRIPGLIKGTSYEAGLDYAIHHGVNFATQGKGFTIPGTKFKIGGDSIDHADTWERGAWNALADEPTERIIYRFLPKKVKNFKGALGFLTKRGTDAAGGAAEEVSAEIAMQGTRGNIPTTQDLKAPAIGGAVGGVLLTPFIRKGDQKVVDPAIDKAITQARKQGRAFQSGLNADFIGPMPLYGPKPPPGSAQTNSGATVPSGLWVPGMGPAPASATTRPAPTSSLSRTPNAPTIRPSGLWVPGMGPAPASATPRPTPASSLSRTPNAPTIRPSGLWVPGMEPTPAPASVLPSPRPTAALSRTPNTPAIQQNQNNQHTGSTAGTNVTPSQGAQDPPQPTPDPDPTVILGGGDQDPDWSPPDPEPDPAADPSTTVRLGQGDHDPHWSPPDPPPPEGPDIIPIESVYPKPGKPITEDPDIIPIESVYPETGKPITVPDPTTGKPALGPPTNVPSWSTSVSPSINPPDFPFLMPPRQTFGRFRGGASSRGMFPAKVEFTEHTAWDGKGKGEQTGITEVKITEWSPDQHPYGPGEHEVEAITLKIGGDKRTISLIPTNEPLAAATSLGLPSQSSHKATLNLHTGELIRTPLHGPARSYRTKKNFAGKGRPIVTG